VADRQENVEKETVFAERSGAKRRPRLAGLRNDTWPRQDSVAMATRKCAAVTCGPTAATVNRVETQADAKLHTHGTAVAREDSARTDSSCMQLAAQERASMELVSGGGVQGTGGLHRRSASGAFAYGMPRKTRVAFPQGMKPRTHTSNAGRCTYVSPSWIVVVALKRAPRSNRAGQVIPAARRISGRVCRELTRGPLAGRDGPTPVFKTMGEVGHAGLRCVWFSFFCDDHGDDRSIHHHHDS
jgi:hypothetical protein